MVIIFKLFRKIFYSILCVLEKLATLILFKGNGVIYKSFRTSGIPYIMVARGGKMSIGENFAMNNGIKGNPIGCYQRCTFFVDKGCKLDIKENVGISQTAIIAHDNIIIQKNVKIGGGTCIYTSDFHSLNPSIRASENNTRHKICKPVIIEENVFIGAHSTILKGCTIGKNAIIGAGSVVTKSIPENEIWGGNPAKFIKKVPLQ